MPTVDQLEALVDFIEANPDIALGHISRTTEGRSIAKRKWHEAAHILNKVSPTCKEKDATSWRMFFNEYKSKLLRKAKGQAKDLSLTPLQRRLYKVLGGDVGESATGGHQIPLEDSNTPKPKRAENIIFISVRQACIDLVKKHGHSVSIIDEEAFRTLIQLMPITLKEKARITLQYIQKCMDANGDVDDEEMSCMEERFAGDETTDLIVTVKGEIDDAHCNCNPRVTEDSTRCHEVGCPAAAKQPYWSYFEVTMDEATCQICNVTFNWTNITKLKEHLLDKHPTAEFVDDREEFLRGPASDVWSHEETVMYDTEVCLEDDLDLEPPPAPSGNKRKRTSEPYKSRDRATSKEDKKHTDEKIRAEWTRAVREDQQDLSEESRRVLLLAPDRFRSLEIFGQYVAELMKLIPKDKCLKYQVQIVQRLLQEQAAAG